VKVNNAWTKLILIRFVAWAAFVDPYLGLILTAAAAVHWVSGQRSAVAVVAAAPAGCWAKATDKEDKMLV
jgi:hypothetical protein